MAIDISNFFIGCTNLREVNFSSLCNVYPTVKNKKTLTKLAQDQCKKLFESYCEIYPEHKENWEILLKMNKNNYQITISCITANYDLDISNID